MAAYLAITAGFPSQTLRLEEPGAFVVGRAPDCAFTIVHPEISRYHCQFGWDGRMCTLEDLGSRRGTRLNGEVVDARAEVRPGDKVGIGPITIEFGLGDPPARQPEEPPRPNAGATRIFILGKVADRIAPEEGQELSIGRDPKCEVVLNHPGVSRRHATIRSLPKGGCVVTDLHSTAGSFVNGHRFDSHELTVGDRLQIGPFTFQYDGQVLIRIGATPGAGIQANCLTQNGHSPSPILDDVSFEIRPSQFTGILGPSGAGKSTLLNTLAGLRAPAKGRVIVDGQDLYGDDNAETFGLVPQEDIVHRELTVSQALRFAAKLRLPASTPSVEIQKLILQTMDQLGVRDQADKRIARLSGGQRKRVCVAVELLAKPAALFLDEPSSGLDPASEFQLMEVLRELTNTGCTVVCTTHVMENAYLMDELVVLCGGCLVFLGTAQETREYFGVSRLHALYDRLQDKPAKAWKEQYQAKHPTSIPDDEPLSGRLQMGSRRRPPFALPILLERQWAILAADWRNFVILVGQPVVIAVLVAWVTNDQSLAFFFAYVATLWFGCSNAAQEIVKELPIHRRERLVGIGTHSYLGSKFLFLSVITSLQALILYGCLLASQNGTDGTPIWQIVGLLGTATAAVGIGFAISALARSVMQAVLIVPLVLIPLILFSGQPIPANEMKPAVYVVAYPMPTFAAQTLMDASFLWEQTIGRDTLSDHWASFRNLNRSGDLHTGQVFESTRPMVFAIATHIIWTAVMYLVAWSGLRRQERRSEG